MTKMLQLKKQKRRILISTLLVCFCLMGGVTYAWYVSTNTVSNEFATGEFSTTIVENFTAPVNWEPGATTDKVVQVVNTGTIDAFTRVELEPNLAFDSYNLTLNASSGYEYIYTDVPTTQEAMKTLLASQHYAQERNTAIDAIGTNADLGYKRYSNVSSLGITFNDMVNAGGNSAETASWNGNNLPVGLVLYVRENTGTTTVPDSLNADNPEVIAESGDNYDFKGYYVYKNTDGTYTYFKIKIEADNSSVDGHTDSTEFVYEYTYGESTDSPYGTTITAALLSKLKFKLYNVTTYICGEDYIEEYGADNLYKSLEESYAGNMLKINFYTAESTESTSESSESTTASTSTGIEYDTVNWYREDGVKEPVTETTTIATRMIKTTSYDNTTYFYYRHVLKPGECTTPLVDSITFNEDGVNRIVTDGNMDEVVYNNLSYDYMTNIRYKLAVNEVSTQAIFDAAAEVYGPYGTTNSSITNKLFTLNTDGETYDYTNYKNYVIVSG